MVALAVFVIVAHADAAAAAAAAAAATAWPPAFESYTDSKADLDAAIAQHPPFGVWLQTRIIVNPTKEIRCNNDCGLFWPVTQTQVSILRLSTHELKQKYVEETMAETRVRNARRAIAEFKLVENAIEYTKLKDGFDVRMEFYSRARKTYHNEDIEKPSKPVKLLEMLMFEKIANGSDGRVL